MQDYARPLGDAVKVARNDLKLTQEQVASQTNTDPPDDHEHRKL